MDFGRVVEAYADDEGGRREILLGREVAGLAPRGHDDGRHQEGAVDAERVVVCGGVHADRLATLSGAPPEPRIVPFRGDYLVLRPERRHLVRGLVYPVPDPAFPFLGIHTTVRPDGEVWLGPNAVLALAREGYRRRDVSLRDLRETMRSRGFRRLARRHWRMGGGEMVRDLSDSSSPRRGSSCRGWRCRTCCRGRRGSAPRRWPPTGPPRRLRVPRGGGRRPRAQCALTRRDLVARDRRRHRGPRRGTPSQLTSEPRPERTWLRAWHRSHARTRSRRRRNGMFPWSGYAHAGLDGHAPADVATCLARARF